MSDAQVTDVVNDDLGSLDLSERVCARVHELIQAGTPSDRILKGVLADLRGGDESLRVGLCWYLGTTDLTVNQRSVATEALRSVVESTALWRRWRPNVLQVLWAFGASPLAFGDNHRLGAAMGLLVLAASAATSYLLQTPKRRRPKKPQSMFPIQALRVIERLQGQPDIGLVVRLVREGVDWVQPLARTELRRVVSRMDGQVLTQDCRTIDMLLALLREADAVTARAAATVVGRSGLGWLSAAIQQQLRMRRPSGDQDGEQALASTADAITSELQGRALRERRQRIEAYARYRHQARASADELTSDELSKMTEEIRHVRAWKGALLLRVPACAVVGMIAAAKGAGLVQSASASSALIGVGMALFLGTFVALGIGALLQPALPKSVADAVNVYGVRSIGMLIEATGASSPGLTEESKAALAHLLPRIRAADAAAFSPAQRQRLLDLLVGPWIAPRERASTGLRRLARALMLLIGFTLGRLGNMTRPMPPFADLPSGSPSELPVAILQALMHIGDAGDLSGVRLVYQRTRRSPRMALVHAAAYECLAILEERAAYQAAKEMLLRPADPTDDSSLLRPVSEPDHTPDAMLVRPIDDSDRRQPIRTEGSPP